MGKRVKHLYENTDGSMKWFDGLVTDIMIEDNEYMFTICYDEEPGLSYTLNLLKDLESNELKLLEVNAEYFVGRRVDLNAISSTDGQEYWYK